MVEIRGKQYKYCFLDTCILSEYIKNKSTIGHNLVNLILEKDYAFCTCFSNLFEMRKSPTVFDEFIDYCHSIPFFVLKGRAILAEEEILNYNSNNIIDPMLLFINTLDKTEFYKGFKDMFNRPEIKSYSINFDSEKPEILKSILSFKKDYKPENKKFYTTNEINEWVELVTTRQIIEFKKDFFDDKKDELHLFNYKKFPSIMATCFITFFKFYINKKRKPRLSDVDDILFCANLPYVEVAILEKDLYENIRQIKQRMGFLSNLEIYNINELR